VARFDRTIPPGGEGKITLELNTKGYQGKLHKKANITCNDPKTPRLTIGIKGIVWAPIRMKPKHARLAGVSGRKIERIVRLEGAKEEPLELKLASVSIPDKVSAKLEVVEKGRVYNLKIENKTDKLGSYKGKIKLTSNYAEKPEVVVKVVGDIRPIIQLRPKVLKFGPTSEQRVEQLQNSPFAKRAIMVFIDKESDVEIEKVESEKSLFRVALSKISMAPMIQDTMIQIFVEPILAKLKKGLNEDRVKVYTNQKGYEVLEATVTIELL